MPTYLTVVRMPASFFIPLGTQLKLVSDGKLIHLFSESVDVEGQQVPRELVAEVRCDEASLPKALEDSANAVIAMTNLTSFIANAYVGDPEIELGFDVTPDVAERDFFQRRLVPAPSRGDLVPGRPVDAGVAGPVHAALRLTRTDLGY